MLPPVASNNINYEATAKLKMEITSKPTSHDEINHYILKLEMERLSPINLA